MSKASIDIETFDVPCKVYGCSRKAKYKIGNLSGSPASFFHICEEHAKEIMETLPMELQPTPKEVQVYPTEDELKVLLKNMAEELPFTDIEEESEPEPETKPKAKAAKSSKAAKKVNK